MSDILQTAINRIFDLMHRDDGQAYKEAERFLAYHAPNLLKRLEGTKGDMMMRSLEQKEKAWDGVCAVLEGSVPGWINKAPTAGLAAKVTIQEMASRPTALNLQVPSDDDLLRIWAHNGGVWTKGGKSVEGGVTIGTAQIPTKELLRLLRAIRMVPAGVPNIAKYAEVYNIEVEAGKGHNESTAKALRAASSHPTYGLGDMVKMAGWDDDHSLKIVGFYSTDEEPEGYVVEDTRVGSTTTMTAAELQAL